VSFDRVSDDNVEEYLAHASDGDDRAGVRYALKFLDHGVNSDNVIIDLLAAAQRESGERWFRNIWGVADEHLVSGVTQRALDAVANSIDLPASGSLVVVACAEGDWHSLPAQMFADMLRSRGFAVAFLGASTPVDQVTSFMARHHPEALAVSCSMPLFFSGVTRLANAAHGLGIPVIGGGRALGNDAKRASRLGVDAWSRDVDSAVSTLQEWRSNGSHVSLELTPINRTAMDLRASAPEIAASALTSLTKSFPPMTNFNSDQLRRMKEDLTNITLFAAAAHLVDEVTVLTEMLNWLKSFLACRDLPSKMVTISLGALAPLIHQVDPWAAQFISVGLN
jgi:methanogenic corrinoid protein MtbC1